MTIDLSDDAIEQDFIDAERLAMSRGQIALVRAQIRATLRLAGAASQPAGQPDFLHLPQADGSADIQIAVGPFGDSYSVPAAAVWQDRLEAAARMLGVEPTLIASVFPEGGPGFSVELGEVHFTERQWAAVETYVSHAGSDREAVLLGVDVTPDDDLDAEQADADSHAADQVAAMDEEDVFAEAKRARKGGKR